MRFSAVRLVRINGWLSLFTFLVPEPLLAHRKAQRSTGPGLSFSCSSVSFTVKRKPASFMVELMLLPYLRQDKISSYAGNEYLWLYKQSRNKVGFATEE